ncbi:hypothetical protein J2046_003086 [Rhizobium petrolearium]|uniref:DUF6665 family protein n=1 Tax=Neorhizobium petrolearium TaxID=515361 RepID=UPI001AEAE624|nr:DUF6665 family protein [Neorhizobium petrolearium]MBP1844819.1 hypothetical protein [Neorhizobium petrolearium]
MSFRPPHSFKASPETGFNVLEYELASERADALGRHGRKVEAALAALAAWKSEQPGGIDREALVDKASDAVWAFFIQREICGLRNSRDVISRYGIPNEVLARLGAVRK